MSKRQTAAERYKSQGKVQFACWIDPKVLRQIKMIANLEEKTIPEVLASRFSDVKIESSTGKVIVKFSKQLEEA